MVFTGLLATALYKCRKNQSTFCIGRYKSIFAENTDFTAITTQSKLHRLQLFSFQASCNDPYPVGVAVHFASVYGSMWISPGNFIVTHANPNVVRALSVSVKISYAVNLDRWRRTSRIFQIAYANIYEGIYSCLLLSVTSSRPLSHGTFFSERSLC